MKPIENAACPHRVGDAVTFVPAAFIGEPNMPGGAAAPKRLNGRVIYVNPGHRYYTAEAPLWGYRIRESFKF